ncbi:MAG: ATP-binding protein, partial [Thermomicrobiales bacterium]
RACLAAYLRDRQLLLVLDNFEHVMDEALLVAELLAACPLLTVFVTSREALHLRGEYDFALAPLPLPEPTEWSDLPALAESPPVAIFCQRAQAAAYSFALTAGNAQAVATICTRLDGLPLAIELAAARVRFFGPDLLLARLAARLPELTDGPRDAPARQRTMQSAIDWSYRALDDAERSLFAQLATFIGGCTLDAAAAVCAADGGRDAVTRGVLSLVAKNLLRRAEGAEPRVGMLETIREYGLDVLAARGDAPDVRRRHAAYFLALAERAEPELTGAAQAVWSATLLAEHDNLRAALRWAAEEGETEIGLRLAAALWRFWEARGYLTEAREWLSTMLAAGGSDDASLASVRARALNGASMLAYRHGDYAAAVRFSEECLALSDQHGDSAARSEALGNLGFITYRRGDNERAVTLIRESLALARETGDLLSIATALNRLGIVESYRGNHAVTVACYDECLALHRRRGHQRNIGNALDNLGCAMRRQGDFARAVALSGESLAVFRALGDDWGIANALLNLADTARDQGDSVSAKMRYMESLPLYERVGNLLGVIECLEGIGRARHAEGRAREAARLCGAAAALRETLGTPLLSVDRLPYERAVEAIRSTLGPTVFHAEWDAGAALSRAQAIAEAIEGARPLARVTA